MRLRMPDSNHKGRAGRADNPLQLAVGLVVDQISQGICLTGIQFASKYHGVTCAAIERVLLRREQHFHSRY